MKEWNNCKVIGLILYQTMKKSLSVEFLKFSKLCKFDTCVYFESIMAQHFIMLMFYMDQNIYEMLKLQNLSNCMLIQFFMQQFFIQVSPTTW